MDWDLAPSAAIQAADLREGYYTAQMKNVKPGSYRIQAEIGGAHSPWRQVTVR